MEKEKQHIKSSNVSIFSESAKEEKTISLIGGISFLFSNMTGPGLLTIPLLFQQAGWLTTCMAFLVAGTLSILASTFTAKALRMVKGNENYERKLEFAVLLEAYFGRRVRGIANFWIYMALQSVNIASIVVCIQTMDNILIAIAGKTCALTMTGKWECVYSPQPSESPFGNDYIVFSIGYLIALVGIAPLSTLHIVDNIIAQIMSLFLLCFIVVEWIVVFCIAGLNPNHVPIIGADQSQVLGTVFFNYAFANTIPSWLNAKDPKVSEKATMLSATSLASLLYVLLGFFGGFSLDMPPGSNILSVLSVNPVMLTRITTYIFPFATLVTSIPIFVIVIRYNLLRARVCGTKTAMFLSGVVPWLLAIPFQTGDWLNEIVNWMSILFVAVVNFVFPFVLYLIAQRKAKQETLGGTKSQNEKCETLHFDYSSDEGDKTEAKTNSISMKMTRKDLLKYEAGSLTSLSPHLNVEHNVSARSTGSDHGDKKMVRRLTRSGNNPVVEIRFEQEDTKDRSRSTSLLEKTTIPKEVFSGRGGVSLDVPRMPPRFSVESRRSDISNKLDKHQDEWNLESGFVSSTVLAWTGLIITVLLIVGMFVYNVLALLK